MTTFRSFLFAAALFPVAALAQRAPVQGNIAPPDRRIVLLDALVALTPEQRTRAFEIMAKESADLAALPPDERLLRLTDIRGEGSEKIRALLNDEQRRKFNLTPSSGGGGRNVRGPDEEVERLSALVGLGPEQRLRAHKIFEDQVLAMMDVPMRNRARDTPEIREEVRRRLSALLTPDQLRIYVTTTIPDGGGLVVNPVRLTDWADQNVALTDEQVRPVVEIYARMAADLQVIPAGEQPAKRSAIRTTAAGRIRALLNPEQQARFDLNPNQSIDVEEQAMVASIVKTVPSVDGYVGDLRKLVLRNSTIRMGAPKQLNDPTFGVLSLNDPKFGKYMYNVVGDRTEVMTVSWERLSPNHPVKVVKIETADGTVLPLPGDLTFGVTVGPIRHLWE